MVSRSDIPFVLLLLLAEIIHSLSSRSQSNDASLPPLDNPSKWVTGGDAPTDRQKGFIGQLAESTGEDVDPDSLTKGEASLKIDELKKKQDEGVQSDVGPRVSSRYPIMIELEWIKSEC